MASKLGSKGKKAAKAGKPAGRGKPAKSAQGAKGKGPASLSSPRLADARARLGAEVLRRFPHAEPVTEWNLQGWRAKRPRRIASWKGTIDPNFVYVFLAERKQGIVLYFWNPFDPKCLERHAPRLKQAGLTAMVGCLQHARRGEYPVEAVLPLLDEARAAMDAERGA